MNALPAEMPRFDGLVQEYQAKAHGGQITRENRDGTIDVIAEYAGVAAEIAAFEAAKANLKAKCQIGTRYVGALIGRDLSVSLKDAQKQLLQSAWWQAYDMLQIDRIAPSGDRSRIAQMIEGHCPDFTLENLWEEFGKYHNPRPHLLRGLAEQFVKLDPAFKSHDRMKIGVRGLPKRVILPGCQSDFAYQGNGADRLLDVLNAVRAFNGFPLMTRPEINDFMVAAKNDVAEIEGFRLRRFSNGNAHLFFAPETLRAVNLALAEYYGEVLADCTEAAQEKHKATSTEIAKDLQFYRTPAAAAEWLVYQSNPREGMKILEPSCGDGAILDAIRKYGVGMSAFGIEVHRGRAEAAKAKGHSVLCANFLQTAPDPRYDMVLMNPPFYGKHYQKHVEHALKFLKPGGVLYAILPVTAVTDHGYVKPDKRGYDKWRDLPVGSFSESGTNINTGIAKFRAGGTA
jgi:predicted RNA methylase